MKNRQGPFQKRESQTSQQKSKEKKCGKATKKECNQLHFLYQITQRMQQTAFFLDFIENFAVRCISYIPYKEGANRQRPHRFFDSPELVERLD